MSRYDVVTFGEALLRVSTLMERRLEQTETLTLNVGGSEANVAVGLARLGLSSCWFSRLTDNSVGRLIEQRLKAQGVDTSQVLWSTEKRNGLYFYEPALSPRTSRVTYDRNHTAFRTITPNDVPTRLFSPEGARVFHTSGINVALGDRVQATLEYCIAQAKKAGWLISFDVNYRSSLMSPEEAKDECHQIMRQADLIFIPLRDANVLFQLYGDAAEVTSKLGEQYPNATLIVTLGSDGALARDTRGELYHQAAISTQGGSRIGRGDAFVVGFLYKFFFPNAKLTDALAWGVAAGALKATIEGDFPLLDVEEIEQVLESVNEFQQDVLR